MTLTVTCREPHGVLKYRVKSPRELLSERTWKLFVEVCVTCRLFGPSANETEPDPPVIAKLKSEKPPFLRIESAGGVMVTTQDAGLGDGEGDGFGDGLASGLGDESGDGLGLGLGDGS